MVLGIVVERANEADKPGDEEAAQRWLDNVKRDRLATEVFG